MEYIVQGYEPKKLFEFFEEICAIPHGSGNESAIAEYLVDFANARGLECHRDAVNNVFIKAPATKGLEDRPAILLQGHTDMVCEYGVLFSAEVMFRLAASGQTSHHFATR